jgi:hypothetical protein
MLGLRIGLDAIANAAVGANLSHRPLVMQTRTSEEN